MTLIHSQLNIVRRIRGNVHGTIDVTALEDKVIAHPYVQRLRRIKQLAFLSYVFPGATHTRFEHSLGVMQLAGITWEKMWGNQQRLAHTCSKFKDFAAYERRENRGNLGSDSELVHGLLSPTFKVMDELFSSPYSLQALRLAALLHDLGHPPFSHSGERFMPTWTEVRKAQTAAPRYLQDYLEKACERLSERGKDPSKIHVRHEVYTLLMIERMFRDLSPSVSNLIQIDPRDILSIIVPDITPHQTSPLMKHGGYRLCHELISGEVDIDRMDYLLRDSRECGVVYGIFDATRIMDSLTVYYDPLDSSMHLAITMSGLAAFEDYLRARQSMYLQVYFHKTSVAAEAMMKYLAHELGGLRFPAEVEHYARLDEYNVEGYFRDAMEQLPPDRQQRQSQVLDDLLKNRQLWKRVYEHSTAVSRPNENHLDEVLRILDESGTTYEHISSSSYLTTFRRRHEREYSSNYLRLIKKDELQFPRVVPVEDYTTLAGQEQAASINRIYVENRPTTDGTPTKAAIAHDLIRSRMVPAT